MRLTFVDAGVLIAASRGGSEQAQVAFYEAFFAVVSKWATDLQAITDVALLEASNCGVEAMDALHVAAAAAVGATELVTAEKSTRSIHRARAVKVVTIQPGSR